MINCQFQFLDEDEARCFFLAVSPLVDPEQILLGEAGVALTKISPKVLALSLLIVEDFNGDLAQIDLE